MSLRDDFKMDWPEAEFGDWRINQFTVNDSDHQLMQLGSFFSTGRRTPPGSYTRLLRKGTLVMSDTPDEAKDHFEAYYQARGRVLVHGLGLGCFLKAILLKEKVTSVDVVEISPQLIEHVGQHFRGDDRVRIHQGDAYTFRFPPGTRWDVVWHDIWDDLCEDNLDGMAKLHRRYGRRCDWQGSWGREHLLRVRRQTRDAPWRF